MSKKIKKLNHWTLFDTVVTILALFAVVITLYPMIYTISCSISDPKMVMAGKVTFLPKGFSLKAYGLVMKDMTYWRCFMNSIGYVTINTILMLTTTVCMSYPLTRPDLKFRKLITYYLLIPMYFSGGMIPSFIIVTKLGLYNSPLSLILPFCVGIWNIILCRTFMASLPNELIEAAQIDGSSEIQSLIKIVLPLSKPVLAVIAIYTIVGEWNSWFSASIYTTERSIQPIQLYMRHSLEASSKSFAEEILDEMPKEMQEMYKEMALSANQIRYAMIVLTVIPIIFVYPFFQKHFTKGVMLGSLKG